MLFYLYVSGGFKSIPYVCFTAAHLKSNICILSRIPPYRLLSNVLGVFLLSSSDITKYSQSVSIRMTAFYIVTCHSTSCRTSSVSRQCLDVQSDHQMKIRISVARGMVVETTGVGTRSLSLKDFKQYA